MKQLALPKKMFPDGPQMVSKLTASVAWRRGPLILAACVLAFAAGCQEEPQIRRYQESREEIKKDPWRLIGAIIPHEKKVWFFRLEGPPDQVALQKKAFDQFVQTIRFTGKDKDKEAIAWKVPSDWEQDKGDSQFRYATMRMGPEGKRLEMTVIPLPREGGADSILKNICRWRDQLGLEPIPDSKLSLNTQNIKVDDVPVTVVDISGFQPAKKMPRVALKNPHEKPKGGPPPEREAPLTFKTPKGWKQKPADGFRLAAFTVGDDALVTVIPLGKMAGSVLDNVNRWRKEVDLGEIAAGQLDVQAILVAGEKAHYVDLSGPQKRILAVMLPLDNSTMFFKMIGPVTLVGREKPAFEAFVRSVKFTDQGR